MPASTRYLEKNLVDLPSEIIWLGSNVRFSAATLAPGMNCKAASALCCMACMRAPCNFLFGTPSWVVVPLSIMLGHIIEVCAVLAGCLRPPRRQGYRGARLCARRPPHWDADIEADLLGLRDALAQAGHSPGHATVLVYILDLLQHLPLTTLLLQQSQIGGTVKLLQKVRGRRLVVPCTSIRRGMRPPLLVHSSQC